jgi:uroporphyrinogen decarboxylase
MKTKNREKKLNSVMTPRERVMKSLAFEETDRVPLAIGGGPYGIVDDLYFRLLKLKGLGQPVEPFREGHNISYLDDRLFLELGTDLRFVFPTLSPTSPNQPGTSPGTFLDAYGQVWKRAFPYFYTDRGILADIHAVDQIDEIMRWPDATDPRWFHNLEERARMLREAGDFWLTARMVVSHGPYQMACDLRGTEQFMLDLAIRPELAHALLDRIGDSICDFLDFYLAACGQYIDMIELPGDDYAGNENLIISPAMFRRFIQPVNIRMVKRVKTFRPDIKVMLHSDGAISKLLPDLIDCGIDVIHPLEPLPATDQAANKTAYAGKIAFLGGIDISHAMPGSIENVEAEVMRCLRELAPGGGFILAPSNHLQADVPPENVVALFEYARQYGKYPIQF